MKWALILPSLFLSCQLACGVRLNVNGFHPTRSDDQLPAPRRTKLSSPLQGSPQRPGLIKISPRHKNTLTYSESEENEADGAASRSKESPAKLKLVRVPAQPADIGATSSSTGFFKKSREAMTSRSKQTPRLAVDEPPSRRDTRKRKSMSLNVPRNREDVDEKDLEVSEELPEGVFSAGRGLRGLLRRSKPEEHHGPLFPAGGFIPIDDSMMTTTDLLKIVSRCWKVKSALPAPGTKGYQFQCPELKKQLEGMQTSLNQLCGYKPLITAVETDERVSEAVFEMLSDRLSERLEWPQTLEFFDLRLDMMTLVYRLVGKLASAKTKIASQKFSASGLHKQMLAVIPLTKKSELELIETSIYKIFALPNGKVDEGKYGMQLDLVKWLRAELLHERLEELEAGKEWACWALGELVMTIRHPKMHEFQSTAINKALHSMAIDESQKELNKEWDRLFFDHIIDLFASPRLENFLQPFRLAWNSLCQYSDLQTSPELGWYRVMAMAEKMASSPSDTPRTAQIEFFIGLFNYGELERSKWRRYFRVLFALTAGQLEADELVARAFSEPGLIFELQDSIVDSLAALNGLLTWAKYRLREAEIAPYWLVAQMNSRHEMYPNEQMISEVLALWTPLLDILHPEDTEHREKLEVLRSQWDVLRKSTYFADIPIMSINHVYEDLPTLTGKLAASTAVTRTKSVGSMPEPSSIYVDEGRLTEPSPQIPEKVHSSPNNRVPKSLSQQELILETRKVVPECTWDQFTSVQSIHILQDMKPAAQLKEEYKNKRNSKKRSMRMDLPKRSQTDTDLIKRQKSSRRRSSERKKKGKEPEIPELVAAVEELREMASLESLELALKQLEDLKTETNKDKPHKRRSSKRSARETKSEPLTPRKLHKKSSKTHVKDLKLDKLSEEPSSSGSQTPTRSGKTRSASTSKDRSVPSRSGSGKTLPRSPMQSKSRPNSGAVETATILAVPTRAEVKERKVKRKSERRSHSERENQVSRTNYTSSGRSVSDKL